MSRKSSYLIISETKDAGAYGLLLNCRHVTAEHLKAVGASENRINSYIKQNLIERVQTQDFNGYRLTDKGYRQFDRALDGADNRRYHSQSARHDSRLADRYIECYKANRNFVWMNEEDLKAYKREMVHYLRENGYYERAETLERSSVPDCVYSIDGTCIGYDVITDNYSNLDIQLKEDFCTEMQCDFKYDKI